jgi:hypothetical protein
LLLLGSRVVFAFALLAVAFATRPAAADCANGADYYVTVNGSTVAVRPEGTVRRCGGPIPMLRQDTSTGEVVELSGYCVSSAYVDECVPLGTYRYGFATPYDCSEHGCGSVYYWASAQVTSAGAACQRNLSDAVPTPYAAGAPWPNSDSGRAKDCPGGCACSTQQRGVFDFDAVWVAGSFALFWGNRRAARRRAEKAALRQSIAVQRATAAPASPPSTIAAP